MTRRDGMCQDSKLIPISFEGSLGTALDAMGTDDEKLFRLSCPWRTLEFKDSWGGWPLQSPRKKRRFTCWRDMMSQLREATEYQGSKQGLIFILIR